MIVTCQGKHENPGEVKAACEANHLKWLWVQMNGANRALMGSAEFQEPVTTGLAKVRESLRAGEHVMVQCAAGIHRTGFFTYALLRICGYSVPHALETLELIRAVTRLQCGKHRIDLAEEIALHLIDPSVLSLAELEGKVQVNVSLTSQEAVRVDVLLFQDNRDPIHQELFISISSSALLEALGHDWLTQIDTWQLEVLAPVSSLTADDIFTDFLSVHSHHSCNCDSSPASQTFIRRFLPRLSNFLSG